MKEYIETLATINAIADLAADLQDLWEDCGRPERIASPSTDGIDVSSWLLDPDTLEPSPERGVVASEYRTYQTLALAAVNYHHIGQGLTMTDYNKTAAMIEYCDYGLERIYQYFDDNSDRLIENLYFKETKQ